MMDKEEIQKKLGVGYREIRFRQRMVTQTSLVERKHKHHPLANIYLLGDSDDDDEM